MNKNDVPNHLRECIKPIDPELKKDLIQKLENLKCLSNDKLKQLSKNKKQPIIIWGMTSLLLKERKKALRYIDNITTAFKRELGMIQ